MKPGRNDPCPCGSGKKYKKCCMEKIDAAAPKPFVKGAAPTMAECNQLVVLFNAGHIAELESQVRLLLERYPDSGFAWKTLGVALQLQGKDSLLALQKATEHLPNDAEAHSNMGNTLLDMGRLDEAEASYRRALKIKPDFAEAHSNLGNILKELGRLDEAVTSYQRALRIKPDIAMAHYNLGNALQDLGQLDEAVASYRRALKINPDYVEAYHNLLFCLSHSEGVKAQTLFAEHVRFGEQFEPSLRANWPRHTNLRNPERPLRIGFVSGDLRDHSVAYFIEPVLAYLSKYPQLSLYAYSNNASEDAVTKRLQEYFGYWHPVSGMADEALAEKICADSIDILIDLSGHTAKNRLLVFARKPAPVQASWMGYLGTTGLRSMDYYLADHFFLPDEKFRALFTEKIVYLPAIAPFMPSEESPQVNALPALRNGHVTFGSFNRLSKLNPSVIALWSQLLRALPESRMVLGAIPEDGYNTLIHLFAQEGIVRERLSFQPKCGTAAYLALHHQIDICLDTFPYSGGTVTNHALWMGVPTLTMPGNASPSRVGATYLSYVGLEGFIAQDAEDFVKKGLNWAQDIEALARIRMELRGRFEQSALSQPALIAESLERVLRIMWQRWCEHLPPIDLDVSDGQTQS